jgi:ubiquinone/menaquinone biosynthesis C-methylase UbiE
MDQKPNAQYNLCAPNSLSAGIGARVRRRMFDMFMQRFDPAPQERVLDIGATSDRIYAASNYFERFYPYKASLTAAGLDDARFLESVYPGVRFVPADVLAMPFADESFDIVHSAAVLEHVGSSENQAKMIAECLRVARRGIFITTPNRWFPIEFHTQLPLVHWLPKNACRAALRRLGYGFFAEEQNLNLVSASQLRAIVARFERWNFQILSARLFGWTSNLILVAERTA